MLCGSRRPEPDRNESLRPDMKDAVGRRLINAKEM
jgi:hypothetical protein